MNKRLSYGWAALWILALGARTTEGLFAQSCAPTTNHVVAWGDNARGQTNVPGDLTNVTAVVAGGYHGLALTAEDRVRAWGWNWNGQTSVPDGLTSAVAVAAGFLHSVALTAQGRVLTWGNSEFGLLNVPSGLSNVVAVAGGGFHTLALTFDGRVVGWGNNHYEQSTPPGGLSNVMAVVAGAYHSLALTAEGRVAAWGAGTNNLGTWPHYGQSVVPVGLSNVVSVAAGDYHNLALTTNGQVVAWGAGLTNHVVFPDFGQSVVPGGLSNVVALAGGGLHSLALTRDGRVVGWGKNDYGQTTAPTGLSNVVVVAAGGEDSFVIAGCPPETGRVPVITGHPQDQIQHAGSNVVLEVAVVGTPPLYCQWFFNDAALAGATDWSLALANLQPTDAGRYLVVVSNAYGHATSSNATLTVLTLPPTITQHPTNLVLHRGTNASFSVQVAGTPPFRYQWFFNDKALADATAATLVLTNIQPAQAGDYFVVVTNAYGRATSSNTTLTVLTLPPTITLHPTYLSTYVGQTIQMTAAATGTPPLRYQWFFNDDALAGKTTSTLTLTDVQLSQAGDYWMRVTNDYGSTRSSNAVLRVLPLPGCVAVPMGAVAWWRAESNRLDSISINDATFSRSSRFARYFTPGKVGLAFYAWDAFLTNSVSEELDVGAGAGFTVEGWINPRAVTQTQPIFGWLDSRGTPGVALVLNNPSGSEPFLEAYLSETNSQPARLKMLRSAHPGITRDVWQHVALTFDKASGVAAIFYNGISLAQTNLGPFRPQTRLPFMLGMAAIGIGSSQFFGSLDEFTVYNRALAPAEIDAIVSADLSGKCPPPPPVCTLPPSDLVAWWRGESNALDHVDGNHGVITQSVRFGAGRVGNGFELAQGYVRVPANTRLDVGAGPGLTVEAWMRPDWFYHDTRPLIEWNSDTGSHGVSLTHATWQSLRAELVDTSGTAHWIISPQRILTVSNWQHVALTYDKASGRAALYLNGFSVAQTNLGSFTPQTSYPLYFGFRPRTPYPGPKFLGALDEISLYSRALGADEIKAIVMARDLGKCRTSPAFVAQPENLRVTAGGDAQFIVVATGNPLLRYQWFKDGAPLAGATQSSLTLTNIQEEHAGNYRVGVSNWFGSVTSSNAVLWVNHPPVAQIVLAPLSHLPGVTNLLVSAPGGTNALLILDGSRSTDVENDPLQYFWSEGTNTFAAGMLATNRFAPGLHVVTLTVSDGQTTGTNSVVLEVRSPAQAVGTLTELVESSELSRRNAKPLLASLQNAAVAFDSGNATAGLNKLQAFQNKVRARIAPLDPALAAALIEAAQEIIDALRAPVAPPPAGYGSAVPAPPSGGKFQMRFNGPHGRTYFIEASTNLATWEIIGVARDTGQNVFDFEDVQAAQFPSRFYRISAW